MEFTPETFAQIGIQANDLDGINAAIEALRLMKKDGKEAFAEQAKAAAYTAAEAVCIAEAVGTAAVGTAAADTEAAYTAAAAADTEAWAAQKRRGLVLPRKGLPPRREPPLASAPQADLPPWSFP